MTNVCHIWPNFSKFVAGTTFLKERPNGNL
jgi:hypothetical protein